MAGRTARAAIVAWLIGCCAFAQEIPQQVNVSAKIIEFQATKSLDTGLSAYFKRRSADRAFGRVTSEHGSIVNADVTFPTDAGAGINVFLDRLRFSEGDLELLLQAMVDDNCASILSRPKALIPVGAAAPSIIKTTQFVPYIDMQLVGYSTVQVTQFRETGVTLTVTCPKVIDDDKNPVTTNDVYIQLAVEAVVMEEGQRIAIALDDSATGIFGPSSGNTLAVPEFVSRQIKTTAWVRNGQVLVLGGLYRNSQQKATTTMPWLVNGEEAVTSALGGLKVPANPISAGLGNRSTQQSRKELIFLLKADLWRPAFTVTQDYGLAEREGATKKGETPPPETVKAVPEQGTPSAAPPDGQAAPAPAPAPESAPAPAPAPAPESAPAPAPAPAGEQK